MTPDGIAAGIPLETGPQQVQIKSDTNLADIGSFHDSLSRAQGVDGVDAMEPALKGVMDTLKHLDTKGKEISDIADAAAARGDEMTPGEMVMLTVRAHEFLFNSQLTSNIANRTSDGLSQLFRQQG